MRRGEELLVGRDGPVEELERLLAEACGGSARAVFVSGEPGIGKTFVLAELVRRSEQRGCLVLEGSAAEFEQALPFGVVIDAVDAYVRSLGRTVLDRLAADGLGELADVLPSLRGLRQAGERSSGSAERYRAYYAVRELLERLAARQPLVLILDDLHWADGASLELVAHLLRRPPDAAVLLAGAYRSAHVDPGLASAIDTATRAQGAERLELGPLSREDASSLLAAADPRARERLYEQSGGNPFYLLALARSTGTRGQSAGERDTAADTAPPAVAAAIALELAGLPAAARSFAEAAAVVGDPFDLDVSAAAGGMTEGAALEAIDQLIARDLVRPAALPRRFQFRHPLVRSAVYQACPAGARLSAHARCAEALAARGAPAVVRAHHVEQSARHGDRLAIDVLMEAGRSTAHRLPLSAVRWFEAAVRLLPETAAPEERVEALVAQARALTAAGQLAEARTVLLTGIALLPPEAVDLRLELTASCATAEQQLGLHAESHARLVAALDGITARTSEHGVALMIALATDGFYQMQFQAMQDWGAAAVEAAAEIGNASLLASARAMLAFGCAFTGATEKAEEHARAAAEVIDRLPDEDLLGRIDAVAHLAAAELYLEQFEKLAVHARRGLALARSLGEGHVYPTLFPCLGSAAWVLGRLDESAKVLDTAIESARLSGNVQSLSWSLFNRAFGALMAGELDHALRLSGEAWELARSLSGNFVASYVGVMHGTIVFENGDAARGAEIMVEAGGGPALASVAGGWRATHLEALTRCWLALGRLDDPREAAAQARLVADQIRLPRTTAMAHLAAGTVALHEGDGAVATEEAQAAVLHFEKASARLDAALARTVLGRALARSGDVARAAAELEQAAATFDRCGAPHWRDRAEQELRALGHRVHRRSHPGRAQGTGVAALSGRELEVARLVVDRRTNPEIAADLFLGLKTVETHMRNIFRKLNVTSRVEVARVLERAEA